MSENTHKYILFGNTKKGANTEAGFLIIDELFDNLQSRNKWYKDKSLYVINYDNGKEIKHSKSLNYLTIAKYIRHNGSFSEEEFALDNIGCPWLDNTIDLTIEYFSTDSTHMMGIQNGEPQRHYGKDFPIKPFLHREGHCFSTILSVLLNRIIDMRNRLILNSHQALEIDWLFNLRALINETISLVDVTLNSIYIKAEYDPLPNWKFSREEQGERHSMRFEDKFNWIYKISNNHINAEKYMPSFNKIRELRNHMMHFDPPTFVISIEEASVILNQIIDIGFLIIKIRQAVGVGISTTLINFILQKEVVFKAKYDFPRSNQEGIKGYESSIWPKIKNQF